MRVAWTDTLFIYKGEERESAVPYLPSSLRLADEHLVAVLRDGTALAPLPQEQVVSFVGCGARYLLENTIPEITGRFDELWPRYLENYGAHMLDETVLYPGVRRTLDDYAHRQLSGLMGYYYGRWTQFLASEAARDPAEG